MQPVFRLVRDRGLTLTTIRPFDVGEWIEQLQENHGAAGVKQQLAAVRMMFNWLITGQIAPVNPAAAVRGPKLVVKTGKTPVLDGKNGTNSSTAFRPRPCAICAIAR